MIAMDLMVACTESLVEIGRSAHRFDCNDDGDGAQFSNYPKKILSGGAMAALLLLRSAMRRRMDDRVCAGGGFS